MRHYMISVVTLLVASTLYADPPKLTIPPVITPNGQYVTFTPETDAVSITYVGLSGIDSVPSVMLSDKRAFVLDTYGKPQGRYKFSAVAASKTGEQARSDFDVLIGTTTVPPVTPPTNPPVNPPVTTNLYFLIVRPDGPASPTFTNIMKLTEWQTLIKMGHSVKDKSATEAAALGVKPAIALPAVATLKVSSDGKSSKLVDTVPLPTNGPDILKLAEGGK